MPDKMNLRRFGMMLDCSRNAVMNVPTVKKWIDLVADMGYNTLLLYTEDTYEVENQPYFGHFRGRYSCEELQEIDRYAADKGMEVIACIQTLAHLNAIMRWPQYAGIADCNDILLAGEDKVYELIDDMFASLSKSLHSRVVNIGMDEAAMVGLGRYLDQHGYQNRSEILVSHLARVAEIAEKYDFSLIMWGDMFFRLAAGGHYYVDNAQISDEIKAKIPANVDLIYWDYYSLDKKHYDRQIQAHNRIKDGSWFAGGIWTWTGFAPHNGYSMKATKAALKSCADNGVRDVFLTMWGDDGAECSKFAVLPALFYASEYVKGNTNLSDIKAKFKEKYGIAFDRFMLLDLPGTPNACKDGILNPEKYMLYNDCFMGVCDSTVRSGDAQTYAACARKLGLLKKDENWGYLFRKMQALCEVLAIKYDIGVRTREAYQADDRKALQALVPEYKKLLKKLDLFYSAWKEEWMRENKPHGFDVQDLRIGGLTFRVKSCMERLQMYLDGKLENLEELQAPALDLFGAGTELAHRPTCYNSWKLTASANVI